MTDSAPAIRKVLPFWIVTVAAAALAVVILHFTSIRIINYLEYPRTNPLVLAETYREEAGKYYLEAAEEYASLENDPARSEKMSNSKTLLRAEKLFRECLKLKPNMKNVYPYLADLASFRGGTAEMYYYKGRQYLSENQYDAAIRVLNKALETQPGYIKAIEYKALALVRDGRPGRAMEVLDSLAETGEAGAEAYYIKALAAVELKQTEDYRKALVKALEKDPSHRESAIRLTGLYQTRDQYDEAVNVLSKTLEFHPQDANLLHRLGRLYIEKKDYAKARETLEKAENIEKNSAPLYFDLAKVYARLNKKSRSTAMLQRAVAIDDSFKNRILFENKE
mgnify:CR=1 FL=1